VTYKSDHSHNYCLRSIAGNRVLSIDVQLILAQYDSAGRLISLVSRSTPVYAAPGAVFPLNVKSPTAPDGKLIHFSSVYRQFVIESK